MWVQVANGSFEVDILPTAVWPASQRIVTDEWPAETCVGGEADWVYEPRYNV